MNNDEFKDKYIYHKKYKYMRNKYTELIKSMEHVVNSNGPLIIEYKKSIL